MSKKFLYDQIRYSNCHEQNTEASRRIRIGGHKKKKTEGYFQLTLINQVDFAKHPMEANERLKGWHSFNNNRHQIMTKCAQFPTLLLTFIFGTLLLTINHQNLRNSKMMV